jgi:predicted site-specific integrase-resolvase
MTAGNAERRSAIQMHGMKDASEISRLSRSTLYEHIRHGRLKKSRRVGGRRLILDADLRKFLEIEEPV